MMRKRRKRRSRVFHSERQKWGAEDGRLRQIQKAYATAARGL